MSSFDYVRRKDPTMSYTAIDKMRMVNRMRFDRKLGPQQPKLFYSGNGRDLKSAALRFIHNRCERLMFREDVKDEDMLSRPEGAGLKPRQIPYNMQMDINRLCLERELEKFIDSGVAEDAYTVYYCSLEMFFGHYGKSKKMVELP